MSLGNEGLGPGPEFRIAVHYLLYGPESHFIGGILAAGYVEVEVWKTLAEAGCWRIKTEGLLDYGDSVREFVEDVGVVGDDFCGLG